MVTSTNLSSAIANTSTLKIEARTQTAIDNKKIETNNQKSSDYKLSISAEAKELSKMPTSDKESESKQVERMAVQSTTVKQQLSMYVKNQNASSQTNMTA